MSTDGRETLLAYLDRMLVGPSDGNDELVGGLPTKRYLMGILFPRQASADVELKDEEPDATGNSEGDLLAEDPVALAGQWLPSSIGLSFFVESTVGIEVRVWGASYAREQDGSSRKWRRTALADPVAPEIMALPDSGAPTPALAGRAMLRVQRRQLAG